MVEEDNQRFQYDRDYLNYIYCNLGLKQIKALYLLIVRSYTPGKES